MDTKGKGVKRGRGPDFDELDLPEFGYSRSKNLCKDLCENPSEKSVETKKTIQYGMKEYVINDIVVDVLMEYETEINFMKKFRSSFEKIYDQKKMMKYDQIISTLEKDLEMKDIEYMTSSPKDEQIIIDFLVENIWNEQKKYDEYEFGYGDIVLCEYCPLSQKYIKEYQEKRFVGKIFYADHEYHNYLMYRINDEGVLEIRSFEVEGCHFIGICRGYYSTISKLS